MPNPIYEAALKNLIPDGCNKITIIDWIKKQIKNSKRGIIKVEASDLKTALGPEFSVKKDSTIYEALRYVMKKYNIRVGHRKKNSENSISEDEELILLFSTNYSLKTKKFYEQFKK